MTNCTFNPTRNQEMKYDRIHINELVFTPEGEALTTGRGNEQTCFVQVRDCKFGRVLAYHESSILRMATCHQPQPFRNLWR